MNLNGRTINPGECRTRVTFEKRAVTDEPGGFQTATWMAAREAWARWTNAHGSEVWEAEASQAVQPATILTRYKADVELTWSVVLGRSSRMTDAERDAARYEIVSMDNIQQRGEWMEIKLKRVRAN